MDNTDEAIRKQDNFRDMLRPYLAQLFAPLGFIPQDTGGRLLRQADEVRQSIEVAVSVYFQKAYFSLLFGFRVEAVEQLYHQFSGVERSYQPESETCFVASKAIARDIPQIGIVVSEERPISDAVNRLAPILRRDVFPFLEARCTIESLDKMISEDKERRLVYEMEPARAMHAVILAYLNRPTEWIHVADSHRANLAGRLDDEELMRYDRLVEYLHQRPR